MFLDYRRMVALAATLAVCPLLSACTEAEAVALTPQMEARFYELSALFADANQVGEAKIVDCTLSGGSRTKCFSVTTGPAPANHPTGPYCPVNITDGPDQAGTWFVNGELYDVDGAFIEQLAVIYQDDEWQMFDTKTGRVTRASGELGCKVAGAPTSAADYKNYCVECDVGLLGADATQTYIIPLTPITAEEDTRIGPHTGVGLAFNGVKLDAPAPMDLILGGHSLGLFDACAGHVNPSTGYHYHGLVGCELQKSSQVDGHAPRVAVAMDGFEIYAQMNAERSEGLDTCGGHETAKLGYHYHAEKAGTNQFIGCFKGESGCTLDDTDDTCDASVDDRRGPPPGGGAPPKDAGQTSAIGSQVE